MTQSVIIHRISDSDSEKQTDNVTREVGLRIILIDSKGDENFAMVHTLPTDYESLIIGLLFTSRLVSSLEDITQIKVSNRLAKVHLADKINFRKKFNEIRPTARIVTGLCGPEEGALGTWQACDIPSIETTHTIKPSSIRLAIQAMSKQMCIYQETGGTHGAALAAISGNLLQIAEDVGRHNAVDRVIGKALQDKIALSDLMLVCSGRLTGDLVLKAAVARIPIVASISAAVESGIELADAAGVTLIGFVRGSRMNVYTHPHRLTVLTS